MKGFGREVLKNLSIGNEEAYNYAKLQNNCADGYRTEHPEFEEIATAYVCAAKEPWHRQAIGYTGRACDKTHPEYLMARRGNELILNLVDAPKAEFFNKSIIDAALEFIEEQLNIGEKVMIVCNEGRSRSASIALLYLIKHGIIKGNTLEDCEAEFIKVYPEYNPGAGIRGFMKEHWREYCGR
jgi:hypothetical protein